MNSVREAYGRLDWWEKALVQAYAWIAKHIFCQDFDRSFDKMVHRFTELNLSNLNQTAAKTYQAAYDLWQEDESPPKKHYGHKRVGYEDEIVNLYELGFKELPDINQCEQILVLNASGVKVSGLKNIQNLTDLTKLNLSGSNIRDVDDLAHFEDLKWLDLSYTFVQELPQDLDKLTHLEFLYLDGLEYEDFDLLLKLPALKVLSLTRMDLKQVPEALKRLPKGCKIYLWDNPLDQKIDSREEGPRFIYEQGSHPLRHPPGRRVFADVKLLHLPDLKGVEYLDLSNTEYEIENTCDFQELRELHLEQNGFTRLPEKVCKIRSLQELYLDNNSLETLPEALGDLINLKYLSLDDNCLQSLPRSIGRLKKLEVLSLKRSFNLHIPKTLLNCTSLKTVVLSWSRFDRLPEVLFSLPKTVLVILKDCELSEEDHETVQRMNDSYQGPQFFFPVRPAPVDQDGWEDSDHEEMAFSDFDERVSELKLSDYRFMFAPLDLGKYSGLRTLDLTGSAIHDLTPVYRITRLEKLIFVNAWRLQLLQPGLSKLSNLKIINFNQTFLDQIPREIGSLANLEELHLDNSYMRNFRFVKSLLKCKKFNLLSLRDNKYENAPEEVFVLPRLCRVRLENNPLSERAKKHLLRSTTKGRGPSFTWDNNIEKEKEWAPSKRRNQDVLTKWPEKISESVHEIDLSHQQIAHIPPLSAYKELKKLDLSYNKLEAFPKALFEITQLEELSLTGNPFKTIPEELFHLVRLKILKLESTDIERLPPQIGNLTKLEVLSLSSNKAFDSNPLPEELLHCIKLRLLDLTSCGFKALPEFLFFLPNRCLIKLLDNPLTALEKSKIRSWNKKRVGPRFLLH